MTQLPALRLAADYGCSPLWWHSDPTRMGSVDPEELGLSAALCQRLWRWAERFDAQVNLKDPQDIERGGKPLEGAELAAWKAEGDALRVALRSELAGHYRIV